jgi:hypothetical protein
MLCLRFLPQAVLDAWQDEGKVDFKGDKLVDLASGKELKIREAVHFVRLESGTDSSNLVKRVKSLETLRSLGAEHFKTSVILGETVYEVAPGWIAEDAIDPPAPQAAKGGKKFEGKNQEADALARLLLNKLS